MTRKGKIQVHIVAAFVAVCLIGWIVMLYVGKHQEEKGQEYAVLTQYTFALICLTDPLNKFEKMTAFEDQISCLEVLADELQRLSNYVDMKNALIGTDNPTLYTEIESVAILLEQGGTISGCSISPFAEDGKISEEEATVIRLLKEETEKLYHDITVLDKDGVNYKYVLTVNEVEQRLNTTIQNVRTQLIGASQGK